MINPTFKINSHEDFKNIYPNFIQETFDGSMSPSDDAEKNLKLMIVMKYCTQTLAYYSSDDASIKLFRMPLGKSFYKGEVCMLYDPRS